MKVKSQNMSRQLISSERIKKLGLSWQELFNPSLAIHANRQLDMSEIKLVGFDMDYTLAVYKKLPMESLQYDLSRTYMIEKMSYPAEIAKSVFDPSLLIRGLVVDKQLGNILKLDDQNHVWRAMHCRRELNREQIVHFYGSKRIKVGDERYYSLDTFFSIPEACLFVDTVECLHSVEQNIALDFNQIFADIRFAMDTIHSNGSLKSIISKNPKEYIEQNVETELAIRKLREENKSIFLLTNSSLEYTTSVLNYVFDCEKESHKTWSDLFDLIIVDAQKPGFFTGSAPFIPKTSSSSSRKILSGGNMHEFHRMCDVRGRDVLYVGDHIYGDILRSKKDSLWRTCLIIKELNFDIRVSQEHRNAFRSLKQIHHEQSQANKRLMRLCTLLSMMEGRNGNGETEPQNRSLADELRLQIKLAKTKLEKLSIRHLKQSRDIEDKFHQHWGRLFKEHEELSRFGAQVCQYACIYTDHIRNFLHYGANHRFFARKEEMTHERDLE